MPPSHFMIFDFTINLTETSLRGSAPKKSRKMLLERKDSKKKAPHNLF